MSLNTADYRLLLKLVSAKREEVSERSIKTYESWLAASRVMEESGHDSGVHNLRVEWQDSLARLRELDALVWALQEETGYDPYG